MLLTDELLLNYKRCQRRTFLNIYGDSQNRDPEREFLLKLREESQNHAKNILAQFYPQYQQPQANFSDWSQRCQETRVLMAQGVECIYQGTLCDDFILPESNKSITLKGTPDLLIKQLGKSNFGDWIYLPINIQLGRRPKADYKIIIAFYAQILLAMQGTSPSYGYLILRRHNHYAVDLMTWLPKMLETLLECSQTLLLQQEPEVFISRQRCSLCSWYSHCYAQAKSQQHLSLVPGVTPKRYQELKSLGVTTLQSLASISADENITKVMKPEVISELQKQALSITENRPIIKSIPQIPTNTIELYFDIEAEPEREIDYLLGVLLVDRSNNQEVFYPLLAKKLEDEKLIWQDFLALMAKYPQAPIFHYSEYEADTIKRLAKLYGTPRLQIDLLLSRLVDIHQLVIDSLILPVESYSLKSLANWLGFQWRDRGVTGDQSVCWYDQWLKSGDQSLLDAILRYNQDDCRATRHLKDWLANFFKLSCQEDVNKS